MTKMADKFLADLPSDRILKILLAYSDVCPCMDEDGSGLCWKCICVDAIEEAAILRRQKGPSRARPTPATPDAHLGATEGL